MTKPAYTAESVWLPKDVQDRIKAKLRALDRHNRQALERSKTSYVYPAFWSWAEYQFDGTIMEEN